MFYLETWVKNEGYSRMVTSQRYLHTWKQLTNPRCNLNLCNYNSWLSPRSLSLNQRRSIVQRRGKISGVRWLQNRSPIGVGAPRLCWPPIARRNGGIRYILAECFHRIPGNIFQQNLTTPKFSVSTQTFLLSCFLKHYFGLNITHIYSITH